ncbi:MLO-like protein 13 [Phoenix dactylifera]|uniref:MLO-like protein n=1 Tax=Phoenix dactylifera TaxID=42345 RepID=A0A8B7CGN7_PHODC|nr:MLO-like protein 13 [Phoenix dactylifera]
MRRGGWLWEEEEVMASEASPGGTLEYTPTWVLAAVCSVIIVISLAVERLLHYLGKFLKHKRQDALFEALQKVKEELMLLGFISLLLTVFQGSISNICIPESVSTHMLPCKKEGLTSAQENYHGKNFYHGRTWNKRRLLAEGASSDHCTSKGKVPLLSLEALHQLHIFIFVLAVVHVVFCATTMVLGGAKIRHWKHWEDAIQLEISKHEKPPDHRRFEFVKERAMGFWRKSAVVSWLIAFFKQFSASVTKSDYRALREGFIMRHCPTHPHFDFHKYMMRALEDDFRRVVGISWYLWLFVVIFLLLNVHGWHTYFWLSFLPLILLLVVGAKLEHIITRLAHLAVMPGDDKGGAARVKPSDEHFWFNRPDIVLYLIHFILFQNAFEIAFFFWIWTTYGFKSCIMESVGYLVPRLVFGVIIQLLCSYSTLPLYAIVSQMGDMFKRAIFAERLHLLLHGWVEGARKRKRAGPSLSSVLGWFGHKDKKSNHSGGSDIPMQSITSEVPESSHNVLRSAALEGTIASSTEISQVQAV